MEAFLTSWASLPYRSLYSFNIDIILSILSRLRNRSSIFCYTLFSCRCKIFDLLHGFAIKYILNSQLPRLFTWIQFYSYSPRTCKATCTRRCCESICNMILSIGCSYNCKISPCLPSISNSSFEYIFHSTIILCTFLLSHRNKGIIVLYNLGNSRKYVQEFFLHWKPSSHTLENNYFYYHVNYDSMENLIDSHMNFLPAYYQGSLISYRSRCS